MARPSAKENKMSNILEEIVAHKKTIVDKNKSLYPEKLLEESVYFGGKPVSLKKYIQREDKSGIIAEFKRKSPSKGVINNHASVEKTSIGYMQAGASGLSILTDQKFFGGKNDDLTIARSFNYCPILRKDFIIDEYQIIEAKAIGADVILLIAAILSPEQVRAFTQKAHELGMEVLLEVHNKEELEATLIDEVDLVGVNNRDLKTFEVSIDTSKELAELIPGHMVKVSESGLHDPGTLVDLRKHGYEGFLMGEYFMKHGRPEKTCRNFIKKLKSLN